MPKPWLRGPHQAVGVECPNVAGEARPAPETLAVRPLVTHSGPLKHPLRAPSAGMPRADSAIFGHGLNEVDAHLFRPLAARKVRSSYIGAFNGLDSADGERAQRWASEWRAKRPGRDVAVYDSKNCAVWQAA
jgi:hypothetical protein